MKIDKEELEKLYEIARREIEKVIDEYRSFYTHLDDIRFLNELNKKYKIGSSVDLT